MSSILTKVMDRDAVFSMMNGWDARLQLKFAVRDDYSRLIQRQHTGPLVFQKAFYPEGPHTAHGLIIHPPGGIAGGDRLALDVDLATGSRALLTTPGATKWYKSSGKQASQHVSIQQQADTVLEWFPQENIIFNGADVALNTTAKLADNAVLASWEITCLGRKASGEAWQNGALRQTFAIERDGKLIWHDSVVLTPDSAVLNAITGLRGHVVFGNLIIAAGQLDEDTLAACRAVSIDSNALVGVSALPKIFTARYIGDCAQEARIYFEKLWACLRPWYGKKTATRPRIWAT